MRHRSASAEGIAYTTMNQLFIKSFFTFSFFQKFAVFSMFLCKTPLSRSNALRSKNMPREDTILKSRQVSRSLDLILLEVREDTFLKSKEVSKYLYLILPVLKNT